MKTPFSYIAGKHSGKVIVVMGGGASLPDDLARLPSDAIRISCNHHAIQKHRADYVCCLDSHVNGVPIDLIIRKYSDAPIISPYHFADHKIEAPRPHIINTGLLAIYAARLLGGWPIVCAGMDFYQSDKIYAYSGAEVRESNKTDAYYLNCINRINLFIGDTPLRFVSGQAGDHFGIYDQRGLYGDYIEPAEIRSLKAQQLALVEWVREKSYHGHRTNNGENMVISKREAEYLQHMRELTILQML